MLVGDDTSFISDIVVYVLKTTFPQELVACTEWNLDDARQFCQVSRYGFLYVSNSLQKYVTCS
jgi:hypothetical protein